MALDNNHSQGMDLDRTDKLPILEGVSIAEDVADDAVRLEPVPAAASAAPAADLGRPGIDLPSLAQSMRSVEERIARQAADYEALNRLYEKARDAQLAAGTRADTLAAELSALQASLAVEQHRTRAMERTLAEAHAAAEAARARAEEAFREAERHQGEARTLRDSLAAREAAIAEALHSLGERDAQLSALQREHARIVPTLEERSRDGVRLEADLAQVRAEVKSLQEELAQQRTAAATLKTQLARAEAELAEGRRELQQARLQSASYLEILRTRDWRSGFNQNLYRDWDDKVHAARSDQGALEAECERLRQAGAQMSARIAEREETIATLKSAGAADASALAAKCAEIEGLERVRAELQEKSERLEAERGALQEELRARGRELAEARSAALGEAQRTRELQAAGEARQVELSAQIESLRAEAATHEEEMTVLMAHLNEARRPVQSIQADLKRLHEEISLKDLSIEKLGEENRSLRATLERTRGALEERELLIRRLERSASTNANVLGRLQTSIERLGSTPPAATFPAGPAELPAELIRLEGGTRTAYPVGRRTRIGRATDCELQIDSQSVSRHHALLLKGTRELIIEDLNSTNGVLVNGHKVTRQVLSDGDLIVIGETRFECRLPSQARAAESAPAPMRVDPNAVAPETGQGAERAGRPADPLPAPDAAPMAGAGSKGAAGALAAQPPGAPDG